MLDRNGLGIVIVDIEHIFEENLRKQLVANLREVLSKDSECPIIIIGEESNEQELTSRDYNVFRIKYSNPYRNLMDYFKQNKIERLLITGARTNLCVLISAKKFNIKGFEVVTCRTLMEPDIDLFSKYSLRDRYKQLGRFYEHHSELF